MLDLSGHGIGVYAILTGHLASNAECLLDIQEPGNLRIGTKLFGDRPKEFVGRQAVFPSGGVAGHFLHQLWARGNVEHGAILSPNHGWSRGVILVGDHMQGEPLELIGSYAGSLLFGNFIHGRHELGHFCGVGAGIGRDEKCNGNLFIGLTDQAHEDLTLGQSEQFGNRQAHGFFELFARFLQDRVELVHERLHAGIGHELANLASEEPFAKRFHFFDLGHEQRIRGQHFLSRHRGLAAGNQGLATPGRSNQGRKCQAKQQ